MSQNTQGGSTAVLWVSWAFAALVSTGYAVIGLATFNSLHKVNKAEGQPYHTLMRGTEAVAVAAPVTVTLLNLFSLFILFYKTLRHTGTGFAYGFINASYLHQGLAVILSCYVLHADREFLNELESHTQLWTHVDTELYELSVYVGYVAAGFLIAEFLFLIIFQEAVRRFDARKHPRDELNDQLLPADHAHHQQDA